MQGVITDFTSAVFNPFGNGLADSTKALILHRSLLEEMRGIATGQRNASG
jgi:hypothetical protein